MKSKETRIHILEEHIMWPHQWVHNPSSLCWGRGGDGVQGKEKEMTRSPGRRALDLLRVFVRGNNGGKRQLLEYEVWTLQD